MEQRIFILVIISAFIALIGKNRNIGYNWSFALCVFLTPIIGLIIILFSKKKDAELIEKEKHINETIMKISGFIIFLFGLYSFIQQYSIIKLGWSPNLTGLSIMIVGIFLISHAYKKEYDKGKEWDNQIKLKKINDLISNSTLIEKNDLIDMIKSEENTYLRDKENNKNLFEKILVYILYLLGFIVICFIFYSIYTLTK